MPSSRLVLAHLGCVLVLVGCADSHTHGPLDDGGTAPVDAARPTTDAGFWVDAGTVDEDAGPPPSSCEAQDARSDTCPEVLCDGPGTWHWRGDSCVWIDCGACVGEDCDQSWSSEAECEAAHATCDAMLCADTGGDWLWWAEECGHYECGRPPPVDCIVGMPVCDCGLSGRFEPGVGCVAADCPILEPGSREALCTVTGGSWEPICCDTTCGELCAAACLAPACNCGPGRVMDDVRGCIGGTRCFEPMLGERCNDGSRCEDGTICCDSCGGAGCSGRPVCAPPVCDSDPLIDQCGNRLDAP